MNYKAIFVQKETHEKLLKLKGEYEKKLGIKLSFNDFFALLANEKIKKEEE